MHLQATIVRLTER